MLRRTDGASLERHVHAFTAPSAWVHTDEWAGYNGLERRRASVRHRGGEWARDDDGDGVREVHANTMEGLWTSVRNYLRPFRGVHKKHLAGYVAMCEFRIRHKAVRPRPIAALVRMHGS